jgi:hypothetical protein
MNAEEDKTPRKDDGLNSYSAIIAAIRNPLGILSLVLLICFSTVSLISFRLGLEELRMLILGAFILVILVVIVVGYICLRDPHFLLGAIEKDSAELTSCKMELLQSEARVGALKQKTEELQINLDATKVEAANLQRASHDLYAIVESQRSLKKQIWALCNQAGSFNTSYIASGLRGTVSSDQILSILGELVEEGKIEGDDQIPQGYYRIKTK